MRNLILERLTDVTLGSRDADRLYLDSRSLPYEFGGLWGQLIGERVFLLGIPQLDATIAYTGSVSVDFTTPIGHGEAESGYQPGKSPVAGKDGF